jgi:hypothetical protein
LKLDLGIEIEDKRLHFATAGAIGRWFDRFDVILSSVSLRLMFNYDETTLAANLSRGKVIVALDKRVFSAEAREAASLHSWCRFQPLGPLTTATDCGSDIPWR